MDASGARDKALISQLITEGFSLAAFVKETLFLT
jgi:hypothetical protein